MSYVLHLSEIHIDLGILYFHLLNLVTLRKRPVLVSSPSYPQRVGAQVACMGHGWHWHGVPDPKPGPFHSPRCPLGELIAKWSCNLTSGVCVKPQQSPSSLSSSVAWGVGGCGGELPESLEGGRASLQRPRPENPSHSLPGLLLASFLDSLGSGDRGFTCV